MKTITASLLIAFASLLVLASPASADDQVTVTVDGTEYALCSEEDCSDQVGQIGVWQNSEGRSFLIVGEETYPITR